ncbi:hypothetical protein KSP40_PGU005119 [Platanthera guangdongensis]|uniref:RING-CH-type domain-containing protein n=1 Tax=Platanthera guangdongensis TaxID=2320717 RepID=A0ABR2MIM2_9ASPA
MGDDGPSSNRCVEVSESNLDRNPHPITESSDNGSLGFLPVLTVAISPSDVAVKDKEDLSVAVVDEKKVGVQAVACHDFHSRSESDLEECRVCQQQTEEPLMDLGCKCRGELSKVHKSCILIWFRTKGSNKCEICQQVAVNIPLPDLQPSVNYCVWRVDSAYGTTSLGQGGRTRGCVTPLWVAFAVLIGGLLLDVLLSILLGVSALPVNIIIGPPSTL